MSEPIAPPDRSQIPRAHIKGMVASLGFDPNEVSEIVMTATEVRVTCIDKRDWPPVFTTSSIPVVT